MSVNIIFNKNALKLMFQLFEKCSSIDKPLGRTRVMLSITDKLIFIEAWEG